ncbi:MAG: hypothetical protein RJB62_271, partial [Pseudomonadota bacterium]
IWRSKITICSALKRFFGITKVLSKSFCIKPLGTKRPGQVMDGAVLGSFDRYQQTYFTPDGEGVARITVVDADGRSATSRVRFKTEN